MIARLLLTACLVAAVSFSPAPAAAAPAANAPVVQSYTSIA